MNFLRTSCSDAKKEYMGPTRGRASSFRLILRPYEQWGVRTLALVLLKMLANSWYLEGSLEGLEASASFAELAWVFKKWRQSSKLLEPKSSDTYKNAAALMRAMLGCSELDMEVSDIGMETVESNDCKGMSRNDGDANGILCYNSKPLELD